MTHRSNSIQLATTEARCNPQGSCKQQWTCARWLAALPAGGVKLLSHGMPRVSMLSCIYFVSARLSGLFFLVALVPVLAVANRRLHDTNHSGWWQLGWFFPVVGWLVLTFFFVQEGEQVS